MVDDSGRDLVFVSYSRDDAVWAQAFTTLLKPLVRSRRLRMWVDTANIRFGERWDPEIARGIARSRVALLLVSGSFLASDYIMDTELPALVDGGVVLAPVLVGECLWKYVPELAGIQWLHDPGRDGALADAPDRDRRLVRACERLIERYPERHAITVDVDIDRASTVPAAAIPTGPTPGPLSGVPALPPGYVVRDELTALVDAVVASPSVGVTGGQAPLGVHGRGGIGKSVLAAALARDDGVRRRFPDGVFWVTAGETPDLLALQLDLLRRLGAPPSTARTVDAAVAELRALLADRRVLLVVDDVWSADAALAFRVTGSQGRVVSTTRDAQLAGPSAHQVDVLSPGGARALAASVTGGPVPAAAEQAFARVGHVPLAVALLAAAVRGGRTWEELASGLDHDVFGAHPYADAFAAMRVAVDALPGSAAEALLSLAVFGTDTRIPVATVAQYWAGRAIDTTAMLDRLAMANVLLRDGDTIGFHDLQHDYLLLHALPLAQLHADLLAAYPVGEWWRLPIDDPYIWDHLVEHLLGAGEHESAVATVTDPAYLVQRIRCGGTHSAETDLAAVPDAGSVGWWRDWIARHAHLLDDDSGSDTVVAQTLYTWLAADPLASEQGADPARLRPLLPTPHLEARWGLEPSPSALIRVIGADGQAAVAWSPDGTRIATGTFGGAVVLWDAASGMQVTVVDAGHGERVDALAWTPDGTRLASGGESGTVLVHHVDSGAAATRIAEGEGSIDALAWSPDGTRLAGAGQRGVEIWDPRTGEHLGPVGAGRAKSVAWSCEGRWIAAGTVGEVTLWDARRAVPLRELPEEVLASGAIARSPVGDELAVGGYGNVTIWDPASGDIVRSFELAEDDMVDVMAWSPDGRRLATGGLISRVVTITDPHSGTTLIELDMRGRGVWGFSWSPDGTRLATADGSQTRLWEPSTADPAAGERRQRHPSGAGVVAWSPDGTRLSSTDGGIDPEVLLWDAATGEVTGTLVDGTTWVGAVAWSPDGRRLAVRSNGGAVAIWDPGTRSVRTRIDVGQPDGASAMAWSPDGSTLATGGNGEVRLWDTRGDLQRVLHGAADRSLVVLWSPDGTRIAATAGRSPGTVAVWDVRAGASRLTVATGHVPTVRPMAWSPDGTRLATGGGDGAVRLWDVKTGQNTDSTTCHVGWVLGLAFSPDGTRIASVGADSALHLRNLRDPTEVRLRFDALQDVAWSEAGIAVAGENGVVVLDLR